MSTIKNDNRILLVEDDLSLARVYFAYLSSEDHQVKHVSTAEAALQELETYLPHIMLLDLRLPDGNGMDILRTIVEQEYPTEVIVITSAGSIDNAVTAMQLGARDFLAKPFTKDRLVTTVRNTIERQNLKRMVETYKEEIDRSQYGDFVGSSLAMQSIYRIIDSAASSTASVFITGESGTGKELCAEAIHKRSDRRHKPFVAINCSAIPRDLIESEVFGHVKGAFTGAVKDRQGAASLADGGTLFLDEIGEMDINLQPKLLRFIQTGQVQPVGSTKTEVVDVRFICATNRDPLQQVKEGLFREDLYYRLHVLPICLPPLREREEDIIMIAKNFLRRFNHEENKHFVGFSSEVESIFDAYDWPGNIRELQNVIRNIVVLHNGDTVSMGMLPAPLNQVPTGTYKHADGFISQATGIQQPSATQGPPPPQSHLSFKTGIESIRPMAELEKEAIEHAINTCKNIPQAAHYLGISAATIYRKKASW